MGEILDIELLGLPPTVNHMYRSGKGIRYKTLEVRQYQQYVVGKLREVWEGRETLMGRIEMHVVFTTNDRRRWDIDNRVKALQDCLSMAGVIRDDSQLDDLRVQRIYGKDKGTRITVRESVINSHDSKELCKFSLWRFLQPKNKRQSTCITRCIRRYENGNRHTSFLVA